MTAPVVTSQCPLVAGPVAIFVDTGAANALEFLGYTIDGVEIEENAFIEGIPSDLSGGTSGPPTDYQWFGRQDRISFELGKFDPAVLAKVSQRNNPAASGTLNVGTLLGCSGQTYRVLLLGDNFTRNYLSCIPIDPHRWAPIGAKFTRVSGSFTANVVSGVIYNTTSTY